MISSVQSFEQLEQYLRTFRNFGDDEGDYDFVGAFALFVALVDNLAECTLDADIEALSESDFHFSAKQRRFLESLLQRLPAE